MSKSKDLKKAQKKGFKKLKRKAVGIKRKEAERQEWAEAKLHKWSLIRRMFDSFKSDDSVVARPELPKPKVMI